MMQRAAAQKQNGVMLIEAMIGILIFSIGILALIGMQAAAVKNTADARYRSEAAYLANRIVSQMRLDIAQIASYDDALMTAYAPRTTWRSDVQAALPGVDIASSVRIPSIVVAAGPTFAGDSTPSSQVTVNVYWTQPGAALPATCATVSNSTLPECTNKFQLVSYVSR
jgi:type IV pilus assembly protein PilV